MHGPTCVFWTNLTPFSLQARARVQPEASARAADPPRGKDNRKAGVMAPAVHRFGVDARAAPATLRAPAATRYAQAVVEVCRRPPPLTIPRDSIQVYSKLRTISPTVYNLLRPNAHL